MSRLSLPRVLICAWIIMALMFFGCAGPWESAPRRLNSPQWSIAPPHGWMHLRMPQADMLSKDGPYLAYILVQSRPLTRGFRFTKQKMRPDMLPHEVAELIADNVRFDPQIHQFRLISSKPARIGGHSGFRLTFSYQDQNGVDLETIYYGVMLPDTFFNLRYTAARRFYFDDQLPAFNRVVDSLRLDPPS